MCTLKNIIKKERQPTEYEKKFANHISDKRLVYVYITLTTQ